jgi:hypothetical protein
MDIEEVMKLAEKLEGKDDLLATALFTVAAAKSMNTDCETELVRILLDFSMRKMAEIQGRK